MLIRGLTVKRARAGALGVLLAAATLLPGCAFNEHRRQLEALHAAGRYDLAAKTLDDERTQGLYDHGDRLLYHMDRGAVALALGDAPGTLANLEAAEQIMDRQHGRSAGDEFISWTLNDAATTYSGEPYEDIYVNVLKLLAQLERGNIEGGATVEARRAAGKADVLRGIYARDSRHAAGQGPGPGSGPIDARNAGEFIESPLGIYLSAVTFMKSGERENQRVAGRRLVSAVQAAHGMVGDVNPESFQSLGDLSPDAANVLIVGLSGRGPTKIAQRFGPIPIYTWPVYFELPVLRWQPSAVAGVRVTATPINVPDESAFVTPLSLVENMAMVATENHRRELPLIYARTYIRSSAKAGASFAVTEAVRRNNRHNDGAVIAAVLGGLAAVTLTERADLRCWVFLPGQAHVGMLKLDPGEWRISVEYLSVGGGVIYRGPEHTVSTSADPRSLKTVVEHFWN